MARATERIDVRKLELSETTVHLVSTSPLIINKFSEKAKRQMLETQQGKIKGPKEPRNPWEDCIEATYWLSGKPEEYTEAAYKAAVAQGARIGFTAKGVKASACSGAYRNKLSKDKTSLYGAFHILDGEYVDIIGEPEMREDPVRIGINQTDLRYRTWFRNWETQFRIIYNNSIITLEKILSFFEAGGFAVGIGEDRIEKGGMYGGYRVLPEEVEIKQLIYEN